MGNLFLCETAKITVNDPDFSCQKKKNRNRKMNCISQPTLRARRVSQKSKMGQIQLILGPMFSGKSTELIRRLKRLQIANYHCLIVKYSKDTRYDQESIATHDRQTLKAVSVAKLNDLKVNLDDFDVIGIDEGQFSPTFWNLVRQWPMLANPSLLPLWMEPSNANLL